MLVRPGAAWLRDASSFLFVDPIRNALGLWDTLRHRTPADRCYAIVAERMARRERNFLHLLADGVLAHPRNPYRRMLDAADIGLADIERSVHSRGLESTLGDLRKEGVYISVDELKGHRPLERFGRTIDFSQQDVLNPRAHGAFQVSTGGSRSAPRRLPLGLRHLEECGINLCLTLALNDALGCPLILWFPVPPAPSGLLNSLRYVTMEVRGLRWFAQTRRTDWRQLAKTYATVLLSRVFGHAVPFPEELPFRKAGVLAKAAARAVQHHGACAVNTYVSSAVRVCREALVSGISLEGVRFITSSEPLTEGRRRLIESSGASVAQLYWISEVGIVASACPRCSGAGDEMHLWEDSVAAVHEPDADGSGLLYFTPLLPGAPFAVFNVEMGDVARLVQGPCTCPLGRMGHSRTLSHVRSVRRITAEGMTLATGDVLDLVDTVLPRTFGGDAGHYQIAQGAEGGHVTVVVDPCLGQVDDGAVRRAFGEHLSRRNAMVASTCCASHRPAA